MKVEIADKAAALRILVLGATGHLGRAITRSLLERGHILHGLARGPSTVTAASPGVTWHFADISSLKQTSDWMPLLHGCDVVINAAGALQDGSRDRLADAHVNAIRALAEAMPASGLLVHISAPGVSPSASTAFYRSKAEGDAAIMASGCRYVIMRPAVVISPEAYGGSALLRALAVMPLAIPAIHPDSQMQTVALDDVVAYASRAAEGEFPSGTDLVLAETSSHSLRQVLLQFRQWFGLAPVPVITIPSWLARSISKCADLAGYVGWRSPLRSTALQVTSEGVTGNPAAGCRSLAETLAAMPATVQERWFARLYLLKAAGILMLALFWCASGVIGFLERDAAASVLTEAGFHVNTANAAVITGALADIALGLMVVVRRLMPAALGGMIALSAAYVLAATFFLPGLWLDPLGPLVKTLPAAMLAFVMLAIVPER